MQNAAGRTQLPTGQAKGVSWYSSGKPTSQWLEKSWTLLRKLQSLFCKHDRHDIKYLNIYRMMFIPTE